MIDLSESLNLPERIVEAARNVELIVLDVDGVLTDGHVYQTDNGEQLLAFGVQDALAMTICGIIGLKLAVISGRDVPAARLRMNRFPNVELHMGVMHKVPVLEEISRRLGLPFQKMAYIGDDLIDLPLMELVGLSVSVPNGVPEVQSAAMHVTQSRGGDGAVRELISIVLKARGLYKKAVNDYLRQH